MNNIMPESLVGILGLLIWLSSKIIYIFFEIIIIENVLYKRSKKDTIMRFYDIIKKEGINVTIRKEFGSNISAACGQLRSKKEE